MKRQEWHENPKGQIPIFFPVGAGFKRVVKVHHLCSLCKLAFPKISQKLWFCAAQQRIGFCKTGIAEFSGTTPAGKLPQAKKSLMLSIIRLQVLAGVMQPQRTSFPGKVNKILHAGKMGKWFVAAFVQIVMTPFVWSYDFFSEGISFLPDHMSLSGISGNDDEKKLIPWQTEKWSRETDSDSETQADRRRCQYRIHAGWVSPCCVSMHLCLSAQNNRKRSTNQPTDATEWFEKERKDKGKRNTEQWGRCCLQ